MYELFQEKKFSPPPPTTEEENLSALAETVQICEISAEEHKGKAKMFKLEDVALDFKQGKFKKVVVLTGAGISVSAGIPDFRSPGIGLYSQMKKYNLPYPEAVFSYDYFLTNPEPFYTIAKGMIGKYVPTKVHYFIRLLQDKGILMRNFTQNIDNLEVDAGLNPDLLVQAHGSTGSSHCAKCRTEVDNKLMYEHLVKGVPLLCKACNGPCKPDIVMFGESLPIRFSMLYQEVSQADLVILIGSSLKVFPFSTLIQLAGPNVPRIIMNRETPDCIAEANDNRDVMLMGDCEESIEKLASLCGLDDEFHKLFAEREALRKKYEEENKKPK